MFFSPQSLPLWLIVFYVVSNETDLMKIHSGHQGPIVLKINPLFVVI